MVSIIYGTLNNITVSLYLLSLFLFNVEAQSRARLREYGCNAIYSVYTRNQCVQRVARDDKGHHGNGGAAQTPNEAECRVAACRRSATLEVARQHVLSCVEKCAHRHRNAPMRPAPATTATFRLQPVDPQAPY